MSSCSISKINLFFGFIVFVHSSPTALGSNQNISMGLMNSTRFSKSFFTVSVRNEVVCELKGMGTGLCTNRKSCTQKNGKSLGSCANGLMTCCQISVKGNSDPGDPVQVTDKVATLTSNGINNSISVFEIPRQSGICQLKVDFQKTKLQNPSVEFLSVGNCLQDSFTVNGSPTWGSEGLTVCGDLTYQHMYLSYGFASLSPSKKIKFTVKTTNANAKYSILVTQIACDSKTIVPENCLQMHYADVGYIKSFGYPFQLNNQKYHLCTRGQKAGVTSTSWSECPNLIGGSSRKFFLTGVENPVGVAVPPQSGNTACSSDYVRFPFEATPTRYCGGSFPTITHLSGHNVLEVHFDADEIGHSVVMTNLPAGTHCPSIQFPVHTCRSVGATGDLCVCTLNPGVPLVVNINVLGSEFCPTVFGYSCSKSSPTVCRCEQNYDEEDEANTGFCLQFTHIY